MSFPLFVFSRQDLPISTRFYTLNLARKVCPQIRVFGMELENPCKRLVTKISLHSIDYKGNFQKTSK